MIGLPSQFRFQLRNDCAETLKLDLKYRAQKLNSEGALVYAAWVEHWASGTDEVDTDDYFTSTGNISNTTDLNLGLEIWYTWTLPSSSVEADGLATLRMQSHNGSAYLADGDGIILASDYILSTVNDDVVSGMVLV